MSGVKKKTSPFINHPVPIFESENKVEQQTYKDASKHSDFDEAMTKQSIQKFTRNLMELADRHKYDSLWLEDQFGLFLGELEHAKDSNVNRDSRCLKEEIKK
eukprot:NODE_250_length_11764_cov_1.155594.p9 type:complete len:102 gc:universal NODE_250_length_11764_cov_1.155594:469-774(+)